MNNSYITPSELTNKVIEITKVFDDFSFQLQSASDDFASLSSAQEEFNGYNGATVKGSKKESVETMGTGENPYKLYKCIHDEFVISAVNLQTGFAQFEAIRDEIDADISTMKSYVNNNIYGSIAIIARYIILAERTLADLVDENGQYYKDGKIFSVNDSIAYAKVLMEEDYGNNMLCGLPILFSGQNINFELPGFHGKDPAYSGDYLLFYNDYDVRVTAPMASLEKDSNGNLYWKQFSEMEKDRCSKYFSNYYSNIMYNQTFYEPYHKEAIKNNLDNLELVYFGKGTTDFGGCTNSPVDGSANVVMSMNVKDYEYLVTSYVHETGHVLDNYMAKDVNNKRGTKMRMISENSSDFNDYYNLCHDICIKDDGSIENVRGYSFKNEKELFADSVAEYYGDRGLIHYDKDFSQYDLLNIELVPGELNALEFTDEILKNGKILSINK